MNRKLIAAAVVSMAVFSIAVAEEFQAIITKVEDGKVTFYKFSFKDKKFEKGDEMTLPAAADVKVVKSKFNKETKKAEPGDPIEGGLKNEMFTKIAEKKDKGKKGFGGGVFATIVTDADNKKIVEIRATQFGGGKKKEKDKGDK